MSNNNKIKIKLKGFFRILFPKTSLAAPLTMYNFQCHKTVTRAITILQHMLQNCYCACDHFMTSDVKGLELKTEHGN